MKKVLLPVYTAGHFTELLRIARLLNTSGRYSPTFWFSRGYYGDTRRDTSTCVNEQIAFIAERSTGADSRGTAAAQKSAVRPFVMGIARSLSSGLPFPFTAIRAIGRQRLELARCRRLVAEQNPDLLVLAEDAVAYDTAALIKAAHERQTPTVIVPFTICNALEPAETYFGQPAYGVDRWDNRLVAMFFRKWLYVHRGRRMVRLPAPQLLAKEFYRLAPPLPWQMNSGAADAIAVESEFMRTYYAREGLPAEKLVVTGAVADDVLAENLQNRVARRVALCEELGFDCDRRLILCALPPDHFVVASSQADAPDYETLVRRWIRALAALPDTNVVVRLHPRSSDDGVKDIEQPGVKISRRDTAALMPLCDLFVASVSATIRWAIACGKPVLNYDVYRLRWTDFDDAPGVLRVEDHQAFTETLQKLVTSDIFFEDVRARQQADAHRWGTLDGHAGQRILSCFDQFVNGEGPSA